MSNFAPDTLVVASRDAFERHYDGARLHTMIAENTSEFSHVDETRYFLTIDGLSGFAIRPDGELVFVWSVERGRGDHLVQWAVTLGASHLDCFDGYLPSLYARHGFAEVRREANWTVGGPDVVYMRHTFA